MEASAAEGIDLPTRTTNTVELLRDEHVRAGFDGLQLLERLEPALARSRYKDRLTAWVRHCFRRRPRSARQTIVLRPGIGYGHFTPVSVGEAQSAISHVAHIVIEARGQLTFMLHRAAAATVDV